MRATFPTAVVSLLAAIPLSAQRPPGAMDPVVQEIVNSISEDRIAASMRKLESFETRNTLSTPDDPGHGTQAARRWLVNEFKSCSPRLQVRPDAHKVKKQGERFFRDGEVVNIVAVLPGTRDPDRQIIVSGHYDTIHVVRKPSKDADNPDGGAIDAEKSSAEPMAPGVSDDGSGTAAVLELARVMSLHEFPATIVFIAFDAEEYGLFGSRLYATKARAEKQRIEAVLNNDIIGTDVTGDGHAETARVRVFSEEPSDSPSRSVARYVKETGARYVPSMTVDTVFREDRFARGGDHTPFNEQGFAAVRFTSAAENFANQHSATDTFANASPGYTTRVARINAAALASLALAPAPPEVTRISENGQTKGLPVANLGRGKSGYAARLRWKDEHPAPDLAGYEIVVRATTAPYWERTIFVGDVHEYLMESVSIDDIVLGVRAVDKDGHESPASTYITTPNPKVTIETQE